MKDWLKTMAYYVVVGLMLLVILAALMSIGYGIYYALWKVHL